MVFLFFLLAFLLLIIILLLAKLTLISNLILDSKGIQLSVKATLFRFIKLFQWHSDEGGLSFLVKKKEQVPEQHKDNKGKLASILKAQFSGETFRNLREHLEFDVSVKGRIASHDAALTAILYGSLWALIGTLIPHIPQKHLVFDFYPDFEKDSPDLTISCILRVKIIHIIVLIANHQLKKIRKGSSERYGTASN
jgi:hypothetical protein